MATASSVQREPSMEEILASIRRIIEDSDSGRKQADEAIEAIHERAEDEVVAPVVEAFRAELHETHAEAGVTAHTVAQAGLSAANSAESTPRPAITLAEVGARIAAEQAETPKETTSADAITADWQRDIAVAGNSSPSADRQTPVEFDTNETVDEQVSPEVAQQVSPPQVAATDETPARSALVSEQTSRQVAAAFGELSEAFASRSRKSFDEMAEEMLRPMLQDWLDNNLPTLVERLVREEIERVARGS
ncbi:PopZ family protein [Mesorhizobium sp. 8]|uniref:PopZ family protein n=1 Tax=Mesorhizobium sp. 8 TaxID=2584466 RepID=UPI001121DC3F|nr:PopZ family protein [Mesorhizobium sp. 8]QDB99536.1 DUF2497 domain-containing protein [Mesorhizobium sp. 8]